MRRDEPENPWALSDYAATSSCRILLLLLLPIADSFGALAQAYVPLSLILRLTIYVLAARIVMASAFLTRNTKIALAAVLCCFLLLPVLRYLIDRDPQILMVEASSVLKLLYLPVLLALLYEMASSGALGRIQIYRCLVLSGLLVLASLFIGQLTGLGGEIKGRGSSVDATKGFMIGANEVGLMLLLTLPFVNLALSRTRIVRRVHNLLSVVIYTAAGVIVFTKSSLAAPLVAVSEFIRHGARTGSPARRTLFVFACAMSAAAGIVLFIRTFGDLLEVAAGTFFAVLASDGIVPFLFRGRNEYFGAIYPQLIHSTHALLYFLVGAGEHVLRKLSIAPLALDSDQAATFEMDGFDLLGCYGLIGSLSYALLVIHFVRLLRVQRLPYLVAATIVCALAHSILAGHVLFSPQVTSLLALVLVYFSGVVSGPRYDKDVRRSK